MSAKGLSSRAIIGSFYNRLETNPGAAWIGDISMLFTSDQDSETYKWLGMTPAMREWIGGRNAKGFRENGLTIANKHFEATIEVLVREMRRDKTGQVQVRINELADRTNTHWASLLSTLLLNGAAGICYDGHYFFDTTHEEGGSGVQSNAISVTIANLATGGTGTHGSPSAPSVGEMSLAIQAGVQQLIGFKDDQGEPMNEMARQFTVMVPSTLLNVAVAACAVPFLPAGMNNTLAATSEYRVKPVANVRLNAWTDKFAVIRTDGQTKPFIRQQEQPVQIKAKAEGSEFEFDNDAHQYGVDAWRNVGYGYWQHAVQVTMV